MPDESNSTKKAGTAPDKDFLGLFWKLSSPVDEVRLQASDKVVTILLAKQLEHKATEGTQASQWCPDVNYSLERLTQGLASDRKASRLGFSAVLTHLLKKLNVSTNDEIKQILGVVDKKLKLSKEKGDEKNILLGRIFALLSVINACELANAEESVAIIYKELVKCSVQKSYLKPVCFHGITELIKKVPNSMFDKVLWEEISGLLKKGWEECDAELFQVLRTCCEHQSETCGKVFLKANNWINQKAKKIELIGPHSYRFLGKMLASTTQCHPRIHPLCYEVTENVVKSDKDTLRKFWKEAIDGGLLESTPERKYLALKLAVHALPMLEEDQVTMVWSNRLVLCVFYALSNKSNALHQVCKQEILNEISAKVKDSAMTWKKQLDFLFQLLSSPAGLFIDENTDTRCVQLVVGSFHLETIEKYVEWLKKLFLTGKLNHDSLKDTNLDTARRWSMTQLSFLVRSPRLPKRDAWIQDVMRFMFLQYHFIPTNAGRSKIPEVSALQNDFVPVTEKARHHMKHCLDPALNALYNLPALHSDSSEMSKSTKFHGTASDGEFWIYKLLKFADSLLKDPNVHPFSTFDDESRESWNVMLEKIEHVKAAEAEDKSRTFEGTALRLLLAHVGIRLLNSSEDEMKDSCEVLSDLFSVVDQRFGSEGNRQGGGEVNWVEVVIETILNMMSQNSHSIRSVADQVFRLLSSQLTRKGLRLILDVLDPARKREILKNDDGLGEEEDMEEVDDADDEDEEDEESSDSDSAFDDEDVSDEKEDEEFREKVKEALGDAADSSGDEEETVDAKEEDKSDSEVEMDDDAMMRIDGMLAEVFRQKKMSKQKSEEDTRKQLLVFQLRCLDLVEILAKRHLEGAETDTLILEVVRPLLVAVQHASKNPSDMTLAEKASVLLRVKICKMKKYPKSLHPDIISRCHDDIEVMMSIAKKAHSVFMCELASDCCLFLIRVLYGNSSQEADEHSTGVIDVPRIQKIYRDVLEDFMMHRESHLQPCVMQEFINRFPVLAVDLAPDVLKYVKDGVQVYRKSRACAMLCSLLKNPMGRDRCKVLLFQIVTIIKEVLEGVVSNPEELKTKYLTELLLLYRQTLVCLKQTDKLKSINTAVLSVTLKEFLELPDVKKSQELTSRAWIVLTQLGETKNGQNIKKRKTEKRKRKEACKNPEKEENQNAENGSAEIDGEKAETKKERRARVLKEKKERRKGKKSKGIEDKNENDEGKSVEQHSLEEKSSVKKSKKKKKKKDPELPN